jgi:hypothetical protein
MEQRVRILKTHRYLALHDNYISPLPLGDCAVIRHPGQVPPGGTRAGIQKKPDYIVLSLDSGSHPLGRTRPE